MLLLPLFSILFSFTGDTYFTYVVCLVDFHDGICAVKRHGTTRKHQQNMRSCVGVKKQEFFRKEKASKNIDD